MEPILDVDPSRVQPASGFAPLGSTSVGSRGAERVSLGACRDNRSGHRVGAA